jgi:uncharacterized protein (TIGR03083 family)
MDLAALLAALEPRRHDGVFVFATLPAGGDAASLPVVASVREPEGLSVVVPAEAAAAAGLASRFPSAWITLGVSSPLDAVGLTAAVSGALARAGIPCNVVAGLEHDHLFVPVGLADEALAVLEGLRRPPEVPGPGEATAEAAGADNGRLRAPGRRDTVHLFRPLLAELVGLLRGLGPEDWRRPTIAGTWTVGDVAAHLLDGDLRRLSIARDGHALAPPEALDSEAALARFVNALNASGVAHGARLSRRLLIDLLDTTGEWVVRYLQALSPDGPAHFAVSWAGEAVSRQWMDTGREYTERWHHQAQIRLAVGAPLLLAPAWLDPVIDISMRALPHAFRAVEAAPGTALVVEVAGAACGPWSLVRGETAWQLWEGRAPSPRTRVRLSGDTAWRLFFNALPAAGARGYLEVWGAGDLADAFVAARAVIL